MYTTDLSGKGKKAAVAKSRAKGKPVKLARH